jgi:hypothetical protein
MESFREQPRNRALFPIRTPRQPSAASMPEPSKMSSVNRLVQQFVIAYMIAAVVANRYVFVRPVHVAATGRVCTRSFTW